MIHEDTRRNTKTIYIIRHCKAAGQAPDAPLIAEGAVQATQLADQLALLPIQRIISSPFLRATQSITPLAQRLDLPITTDGRLAERILSTVDLPDWSAALQATFDDLDRRFEGGESSRTAMQRAVAVVSECALHAANITVLVTHGNLMTLLLKHFNQRIGFAEWQRLTNPDVYRVEFLPERAEIARVWAM
jgi:2,3-bisphosphoglycerate-dependent phosphoglycerate mutase